jgi:hypothetical protein
VSRVHAARLFIALFVVAPGPNLATAQSDQAVAAPPAIDPALEAVARARLRAPT